MGLIDDKRNIFNQIGALTSVRDEFTIPDQTSSLSSVNNTREAVPLMLDMLTVLVGSQALQSTVGELLVNFVDTVEPTLKNELKNQFIDFNSDEALPAGFSAGYNVSAKDIDVYGKLKSDPANQVGSLLYSDNTDTFDRKSYEAIQNAGTDIVANNVTINYDSNFDRFTYKPVNPVATIGEFTNDYIDGLTLIDKKTFTTDILNRIFGTVTTNENKSLDQVIAEEKLNMAINKLIDEDESILITDDELEEIEEAAKNMKRGVNPVDVGCAVLDGSLTLDQFQDIVSTVSGSTDPLTVGNAFTSAIEESLNTENNQQAQQDNQAIKDGFFKRLINAIVSVLVGAITSPPQIRVLFALVSGFKNNNNISLSDPISDLQNRKTLADCLSKTAKSTINEFIFNLIKKELLKLVIPVSRIIVREKINQYLAIIRSLISIG